MAFGLSTENARKWSRKGKSLHPEVLGTLGASQKKSEYMAKIGSVTAAFARWFLEKGVFCRDLARQGVQVRDMVWPPRCGKE
jgi:hypothetical protein